MGQVAAMMPEQKDRPIILASAATFPEHSYAQQDVLDAVAEKNNFHDSAYEFGSRVFNNSFKRGNISLPPEKLGMKMERSEYREYLHDNLLQLSMDCCKASLQDWGGPISDITHLVWATMSAVIDAPSMDTFLVNYLGLASGTRRISISQQGCMSGFRCLNLAAEIAQANPEARVLVCVADVRSGLQNQLPMDADDGVESRSSVIACALFRDAASGVVVGARPRPYEKPKAEWLRGTSHIIKGTLDQVSITDNNDSSISWYNARDMPKQVTAYTPTVVNELLEGLDITPQDPQYVIHPGGPAILKGPQELLGLPKSQNQAAWDYMTEHGNTSGSSNLAVLHHELTRTQDEAARRDWIMCLAAGPGICVEGALLWRITGARGNVTSNAQELGSDAIRKASFQMLPAWAASQVQVYLVAVFLWLCCAKDDFMRRYRLDKTDRSTQAPDQMLKVQ